LEAMIKAGGDDTDSAKENKKINDTIKKVDKFDKGNIGQINQFTSQQFSNLKGFVENPANFIIQNVFKKFAKGAGIVVLALIIFEAVKWVISELLKPGRLLDLRFKRDITKELIAFRQREDQQRLKQGFSNIIITTAPGLRLTSQNSGQVVNTFDLVRRNNFQENIAGNPMIIEASGVSFSKAKGKRTRFRQ